MERTKLTGKELRASFDVSNVYIGALVGPQLVAGTYAVFYYLQAGAWSLILSFIGVGIIGFLCWFAAEGTRHYKVYEYGSYAKKMYNNNRILCIVFDVFIIGTLVTGAGSYLAMAGTFWNQLSGMPAMVGILILSAIAVALTSFKDTLVRKVGSIMSIIMLVGFIILLVIIIALYGNELGEKLSTWYVPPGASAGVAIQNILIFSFLSCAMSVTLCCVEQPIKKKQQSRWIFGFTTIIGGGMMALNCLYLLPFIDEILGTDIPLIHVMNEYLAKSVPWLPAVYYLIMMVAVVSSLVPNIFMVTTRLATVVKEEKYKKHPTKYLLIFGIIFMVVAICVASLGLPTIITYLFSILAYVGIPLVCIPTCIIFPIKFYRERKARVAQGLPPEPEPDE